MTIEPPQRRLRAPQENGAVVAQPPLAEAANLIASNRAALAQLSIDILGRSLAEVRRQAQEETLAAALAYFQGAGEPVPNSDGVSLVMAGHQPELFHPGVWVKNFALYRLAREHGAMPLNLVVDNDTAKSSALRVPVLRTEESPWPHVAGVPIDRWTGEVPYEERPVRDEAFFADLPRRVEPLTADWNFVPLLGEFWKEVCKHAGRTPLLGERLVAARRTFERRWGCHNLELPVSALCRTESFAWFACHLMREAASFQSTYNACVQDHRRKYGIRSRNHPVPDLAVEGDWRELPFWAWEAGKHNRGRLFVRRGEGQIEQRSGNNAWPALSLEANRMVHDFQGLEHRGFKIRSRALTNTLFARLFLADLFIHGIGGGKYDELTDEIIRRFYRCEPPGFLVLSATLLLPLRTFPATLPMHRDLARARRDLHYNPQRHLPADSPAFSEASRLRVEKLSWIKRQPATPEERRERFHFLRALNERLAPHVAERITAVQRALSENEHELEANAILQRRDYAFCLYPESLLKPFCTRFLSTELPR